MNELKIAKCPYNVECIPKALEIAEDILTNCWVSCNCYMGGCMQQVLLKKLCTKLSKHGIQ